MEELDYTLLEIDADRENSPATTSFYVIWRDKNRPSLEFALPLR
jgi:hypothetical protein